MTEPVSRSFVLQSGGQYPAIDALAIMVELLTDLSPNEQAAAIQYVVSKFGYYEQPIRGVRARVTSSACTTHEAGAVKP